MFEPTGNIHVVKTTGYWTNSRVKDLAQRAKVALGQFWDLDSHKKYMNHPLICNLKRRKEIRIASRSV